MLVRKIYFSIRPSNDYIYNVYRLSLLWNEYKPVSIHQTIHNTYIHTTFHITQCNIQHKYICIHEHIYNVFTYCVSILPSRDSLRFTVSAVTVSGLRSLP
jgi:hypothetical protein